MDVFLWLLHLNAEGGNLVAEERYAIQAIQERFTKGSTKQEFDYKL